MPGSEYYDREPDQAEIDYTISVKRRERDSLLAFKQKLLMANMKRGITDRKLDAKMDELYDYIDAKLWRVKV